MTLKPFHLPDIGEGIAEGEIVSWKVKPGQAVKEEDDFVEVMTDKATVTITVPWDGVIHELKYGEGAVVPIESVIAVIDTSGDAKPVAETPAKAEVAATSAASETAPASVTPTFVSASPGKVLAAPATRRRAREMGVNLQEINGTGPGGRVVNEDLMRFVAAPGASTSPSPTPDKTLTRPPVTISPASGSQLEERIPFVGLRRKIAEAMAKSKSTATHFTYVEDINVTELVALREKIKDTHADQGIKITYLPFIMKAVVEAMKLHPSMNSSLDEASGELVIKHYYNFGVATDTDKGLIVPVITNVDQKSISQIAAEIQDLATRTREGRVAVEEVTGGTFSITNAGNIGGLFATPIINFPEVAILGVHAIKKAPIVTADNEIVVGNVMYLSVSIDHRVVDGATGARWMNVVKELLESPAKLLVGSL